MDLKNLATQKIFCEKDKEDNLLFFTFKITDLKANLMSVEKIESVDENGINHQRIQVYNNYDQSDGVDVWGRFVSANIQEQLLSYCKYIIYLKS